MSHKTSEWKLVANRANAQKSTGPRTPEGKEAVKYNGLTHGLSSKLAVLVPSQMTVPNVTTTIVGFYYVHNSTNTGKFQLPASLTNGQGSIVADSFTFLGDLTVIRDPAFNATLGSNLHLPGY